MKPDTKPVPRQFIGMARQFRDRVLAADAVVMPTLNAIFAPLEERAKRNPMPRPELIAGASRAWAMTVPEAGRLAPPRVRKSSRELLVAEPRLCAGRLQQAGWDDADAGLGVIFIELRVAEAVCSLTMDVLVTMNLHCIARWYQRAVCDNSEPALIADIAQLASQYGSILDDHAARPADARFLVRVENGAWAGTVVRRFSEATRKDERILTIATFLQ